MVEQRTHKPDRDERPFVILNGYKGFFVVSLGGEGWYIDPRGHSGGHSQDEIRRRDLQEEGQTCSTNAYLQKVVRKGLVDRAGEVEA